MVMDATLDLVGRVNVVGIATPPLERLRAVKDTTEHVKGILVEKPIASRLGDAIRIVNTVKEYRIVDTMVYNLGFSPVFDYLRRVAIEGSVVSVYHEFGFDYFNSKSWRGRPGLEVTT